MAVVKSRSWTALFVPALLIYTIGLIMVYDASSGEIVDLASSRNEFGPFLRQFASGCMSGTLAYVVYRIGWKKLVDHAWYLYAVLLVMLIAVFLPFIGVQANGARRWISLFGFSLQPSEFVKLFLPAVYLRYLSQYAEEVYGSLRGFLKMIGSLFLPLFLIAVEPNNGTVGVLGLTIGLLLCITKMPWRYWLLPCALFALGLFGFALSSSYVKARIDGYMHPERDIKGKGHQPYQAKIAAGSGGLFGRGPAKSMQKLSYLPEAQNDYIAAIYAEEFGFLGICGLLGLYGWLIFAMARYLLAVPGYEAFTWGCVMLFLVSLQTFMNLGVVSGLLPSTGLNLPFFSQGGSSLMANSTALGILASMSNTSYSKQEEECVSVIQ